MKFKVEIKICGINSYQSAKASIGAEYIGFVFYPKSPRFLNAFDEPYPGAHTMLHGKKVVLKDADYSCSDASKHNFENGMLKDIRQGLQEREKKQPRFQR